MKRIALVFGLLVAIAVVHGADTKPPQTKPAKDPKASIVFFDAEQAGADYALQGEYEGLGGGAQKWGAQVIALGDAKFHASFFYGGLPGDGWTAEPKKASDPDAKIRYESEGQLDGSTVTFHGVGKVAFGGGGHFPPPHVEVDKGFDATLTGDTLTFKVPGASGDDSVTVKKTLRHSPAEGAKPPADAIILFDGSNVDAWKGTKIIEDGPFKGLMKEGGESKQKFTDYTLHVEFVLPFKPFARNQERGNSGVYNQHRYENQVLDTFGLMGMDNECGGVYTKSPPMVNMCYPPLTWQTYDIEFAAARYDNGAKTSDAIVTVTHNGVLIQDHFKINGPTGGGQKEVPTEAVQSGPIYLQEHGNPVFYRNVWIVEKK